MKNNIMVKRRKKFRKGTVAPVSVGALLPQLLQRMGGSPLRAKLANLWRQWADVLGEELAALAVPLGAKDDLLLLGAEDAMLLQELHFLAEDILERVNAFLEQDAFHHVRVSLSSEGKNCLLPGARPAAAEPQRISEPHGRKVKLDGRYLEQMDMNSPVARCYAIFVQKNS